MKKLTPAKPLGLKLLIIMAITATVVIVLGILNHELIESIYFSGQLLAAGLIINGLILLLFLFGVLRISQLFFHYYLEEKHSTHFRDNCELEKSNLLAGVPTHSLIAQRYEELSTLYVQKAPISHSTLASLLMARESIRSTLPKFVNSTLILTGVFGTVVSLSIALLGASNLLESEGAMQEMNLVVQSMSTALSTTITAIVCYFLFGYFYLRLLDLQTHVINEIESITTLHLIKRFQTSEQSMLSRTDQLVAALEAAAKKLLQQDSSNFDSDGTSSTNKLLEAQTQQWAQTGQQLERMNDQLAQIFRLEQR